MHKNESVKFCFLKKFNMFKWKVTGLGGGSKKSKNGPPEVSATKLNNGQTSNEQDKNSSKNNSSQNGSNNKAKQK